VVRRVSRAGRKLPQRPPACVLLPPPPPPPPLWPHHHSSWHEGQLLTRYAYLSGALAGVTEGVAFSPFQVIKVRLSDATNCAATAACRARSTLACLLLHHGAPQKPSRACARVTTRSLSRLHPTPGAAHGKGAPGAVPQHAALPAHSAAQRGPLCAVHRPGADAVQARVCCACACCVRALCACCVRALLGVCVRCWACRHALSASVRVRPTAPPAAACGLAASTAAAGTASGTRCTTAACTRSRCACPQAHGRALRPPRRGVCRSLPHAAAAA
jgi:hypothetical protein